MDPSELLEVKNAINTALADTAEQITALAEMSKPISPDNAIGRISRMEAINERSVNEAALNQARIRSARLEHALRNLDDPDFGYCRRCGEEIPLARLKVAPDSIYCVPCADQ